MGCLSPTAHITSCIHPSADQLVIAATYICANVTPLYALVDAIRMGCSSFPAHTCNIHPPADKLLIAAVVMHQGLSMCEYISINHHKFPPRSQTSLQAPRHNKETAFYLMVFLSSVSNLAYHCATMHHDVTVSNNASHDYWSWRAMHIIKVGGWMLYYQR